jgi:hypothetical protein
VKIVFQSLVGPEKKWLLTVNEDENGNVFPELVRPDGQFFRMVLVTKGFDRPIFENFGSAKICVAVNEDGKVAVEPEKILLSAESGNDFEQNRVVRASADNPKYRGVPDGIKTGEGYPDGQRVIYRDTPVDNLVTAITEPLMRNKGKGEFVPCQMISPSEFGGETTDVPGKAAIFDAFAMFFPNQLDALAKELYKKLNPLSATEK